MTCTSKPVGGRATCHKCEDQGLGLLCMQRGVAVMVCVLALSTTHQPFVENNNTGKAFIVYLKISDKDLVILVAYIGQ